MIKNFDKLDDNTKTILMFNQWLMYTRQDDRLYETSYFNDYSNLRHWCVDVICNIKNMYETLPVVDVSNQNKIFKYCKKSINLNEFKNIDTYEFKLEMIDGLICVKK